MTTESTENDASDLDAVDHAAEHYATTGSTECWCVEEVAAVLRKTGLLGCGCCVDSEDYDKDGCPKDEDGWTDHTFEGECIHNLGRDVYLARAVLAALIPPGVTRAGEPS